MSSLRSIVTDDRKYFWWPIIVFNNKTGPSFFLNWIDSNTSYSFLKDSKNCSMTLTLKGWISFQHTQTVFIFALWSMYFFILGLKSKNTMGWIQRMAVNILFMCNVFCKWIRLQNILYFCIFNYVRGDKQKVWSKAENREQD